MRVSFIMVKGKKKVIKGSNRAMEFSMYLNKLYIKDTTLIIKSMDQEP